MSYTHRIRQKLINIIHNRLINPFNTQKIKAIVANDNLIQRSRYAVVVAMPCSVHLAVVCYQCLAEQRPDLVVLIVENRLSSIESRLIRSLCDNKSTRFVKVNFRILAHDAILNALIGVSKQDFWIVDHDCLVLSGTALIKAEQEALKRGSSGAYFFADPVRHLSLPLMKPHTFLMYLRVNQIRLICKKYRISTSPKQWHQLSSLAQDKLASLGFGPTITPEKGKDFWDTFAIICFLAYADNIAFYAAEEYSAWFSPHESAIHFGNTSRPTFEVSIPKSPHTNGWAYRNLGAYCWRLALESIPTFSLKESYLSKYSQLPSCRLMRDIMITGGISASNLDYIERVFSSSSSD